MELLTFSKHIKFRIEKDNILICDCKLLKDFMLDKRYEDFLNIINSGIVEENIMEDDKKLLFKDFKSSKMLVTLSIKEILDKDFKIVDEFLEKHLYNNDRPRTYEFLLEKYNQYPQFFIGIYLDDLLVGVIQGFPRDDYLLMSEMAVDVRFRRRGFGSLLMKRFEDNARIAGFNKIKLGAEDDAVNFYLSQGFVPSIFIQVHPRDRLKIIDFLKNRKLLTETTVNNILGLEFSADKCDLSIIDKIKRLFNPVSAQFLFTKNC